MWNVKVRPYFDRCLVALAIVVSFSLTTKASPSDEYDEEYDPNGLVEVHVKADPTATYSDRKSNWSWRFSADYESFLPDSYVSLVDSASYKTIFGTNQGSIVTGSFGTQYNTSIGALFVDAQYGMGSIAGPSGTSSLMKVTKYGATFGYMMDILGKDPWISPYIAGQAIYFTWNETDTNINSSGTTQVTIGTIAGVSIHLDKIDPDAARDAYMNFGIKNTFIDIFGVQYNTSNSAQDADLQTAWNVGAGFHFEF